jgi:hypothetical protein
MRRLDAAARAPVTVLAAPAGFGKTTALTEWLATLPPAAPSVAWLSLDSRDNDPSLFWTYVVTAMRTAVDGLGSDALQLLSSSSSPSTEAALAALLNDLSGRPEELLLILDDYHLIEAPDVHEGMTFLLEHRPPQLHVVLATRTDPPLPLARMRRAVSWWRCGRRTFASLSTSPRRTSTARWNSGSARVIWPRSTAAPKGGSLPCSSPRCRCRGGTTSARSSSVRR